MGCLIIGDVLGHETIQGHLDQWLGPHTIIINHHCHQVNIITQTQRPSPISINSPVFFPEKTTVDILPSSTTSAAGRATYIAPSPSRNSSPSETGGGGGGGPPSMISQTYSDIDSVLRETEELVQSVL